MKQFPDHKFVPNETVYRDSVTGRIVRRLYLIDMSKALKPMQPAYEVQFTDGRCLILEENELSLARTTPHADYAAACIAAEGEL